MHPYGTNRGERERISLLLIIASVLAAWLLHIMLDAINFRPPWYIDAPSVFAFYELFFRVFDKRAWKAQRLRNIGLVHIANLNGTWRGHLRSSYDKFQREYPATIEVTQTWTEILIRLRTTTSSSGSRTASVLHEPPDQAGLFYEYQNEPIGPAVQTMQAHKGTGSLTWRREGDRQILEGDYYTGRGRQNYGVIRLERQEEIRQRRFPWPW